MESEQDKLIRILKRSSFEDAVEYLYSGCIKKSRVSYKNRFPGCITEAQTIMLLAEKCWTYEEFFCNIEQCRMLYHKQWLQTLRCQHLMDERLDRL